MSLKDVITGTYAPQLWAILEASPDFAGTPPYTSGQQRDKVLPGNRIKWTDDALITRQRKGNPASYPRAELILKGGSYALNPDELTLCGETGAYGGNMASATFAVNYELSITSDLLKISTPDFLIVAALDAIRSAGQRLTVGGVDAPLVTAVGPCQWATKETPNDEANGTFRLVSTLAVPVTHAIEPGTQI